MIFCSGSAIPNAASSSALSSRFGAAFFAEDVAAGIGTDDFLAAFVPEVEVWLFGAAFFTPAAEDVFFTGVGDFFTAIVFLVSTVWTCEFCAAPIRAKPARAIKNGKFFIKRIANYRKQGGRSNA